MSWFFCNTTESSPWGSSVYGISKARILEWVAISFSRRSSQPKDWTCVFCIAGKFFMADPLRTPTLWHSQASLDSHYSILFRTLWVPLERFWIETNKKVNMYICYLFTSLLSDFVTLCSAASQAPLSLGFSRQQYWTGLPCPHPGDLPNPGIEPGSPASQKDSLPTESPGNPMCVCTYAHICMYTCLYICTYMYIFF